jgi:hypothetical protein
MQSWCVVVITFGDVSPIAWNFLMAYNLYRWVCLGEDQQMLQRRIKWYICGTLVFTLTIDTLALGCTYHQSFLRQFQVFRAVSFIEFGRLVSS